MFLKKLYNFSMHIKGNLFNPQEFPPGHYHSPIPSSRKVKDMESRIFHMPRSIPSVDLNEAEQIKLLEYFKGYYDEIPFKPYKEEGLTYYFENEFYSYSDAIFLYCMIRHVKPKRIIEVGSGYSSCAILDTNEIHFNGNIHCSFIEPFPERLVSLIKSSTHNNINLINQDVQDTDANIFRTLSENDILFIDSTHISKVNSDVNYIFFEVLPNLNKGVYVHFHDIFYPFEYPKEWVLGGRSWNESYLLRAFLQYNDSFKIVFYNTYLQHILKNKFLDEYPLCLKNTGGSIWLKKHG